MTTALGWAGTAVGAPSGESRAVGLVHDEHQLAVRVRGDVSRTRAAAARDGLGLVRGEGAVRGQLQLLNAMKPLGGTYAKRPDASKPVA